MSDNASEGTKHAVSGTRTILGGEVVATFLEEMMQLSAELRARRTFGEEVGEFLKEFGMIEDFEKWRNRRNTRENTDVPSP